MWTSFARTNPIPFFSCEFADLLILWASVRSTAGVDIKVHPVRSPFPHAIKGYKPRRRLRRDAVPKWLSRREYPFRGISFSRNHPRLVLPDKNHRTHHHCDAARVLLVNWYEPWAHWNGDLHKVSRVPSPPERCPSPGLTNNFLLRTVDLN